MVTVQRYFILPGLPRTQRSCEHSLQAPRGSAAVLYRFGLRSSLNLDLIYSSQARLKRGVGQGMSVSNRVLFGAAAVELSLFELSRQATEYSAGLRGIQVVHERHPKKKPLQTPATPCCNATRRQGSSNVDHLGRLFWFSCPF